MNTATKVGLGVVGVTLGALTVYVTKECIKEYNSVIEENDKLREYIAKELIDHDCKVDVTLSNGKRIVHEVEKKVVPKMVDEMEDKNIHVKTFDNGFKVISYKTKGA